MIPQNLAEFCKQYGNVYACALKAHTPNAGLPFALGETALWVLAQVQERGLKVEDVVYVDDDCTLAVKIAEEYNKRV